MIEEYGPIMTEVASLLGGTWLLIHALGQIKLAKSAAMSWLKAHGNVIKSSKRISNFGSSKSRNKKENTYLLDFEYEYVVDGHKYKSTKPLFFGLYVLTTLKVFYLDTQKVKKSACTMTQSSLRERSLKQLFMAKAANMRLLLG